MVRIGYKIGRKIAPIELHSLHILDGGLQTASFFDCNHAIFANTHKSFGHFFTDFKIIVGADCSYIDDVIFLGNVNGLGY